MTAAVLSTKISEVENKIPSNSSLVTTTVFNTKISKLENKSPDNSKYITTQEFNKLTAENFVARLKQANLVNKTDFDNKLTNFNKQIISNKTKHLEIQKKVSSLTAKATNKGTDYVLSWKSKGLYTSKLKPLYTASLHSIKLCRYRIGIKFNKDTFAVEQKNYLTKILNVYTVYEYAWPRNPTNNFKFRNFLFGVTNVVKNTDKEKYVYGGYRITFDSAGSWGFNNDLPEML